MWQLEVTSQIAVVFVGQAMEEVVVDVKGCDMPGRVLETRFGVVFCVLYISICIVPSRVCIPARGERFSAPRIRDQREGRRHGLYAKGGKC